MKKINLLMIEDVIVWIFSHRIKENRMKWEKCSNHHIPTLVDTDFCLCYTVRRVKGVDRARIPQSQKHKKQREHGGSIYKVKLCRVWIFRASRYIHIPCICACLCKFQFSFWLWWPLSFPKPLQLKFLIFPWWILKNILPWSITSGVFLGKTHTQTNGKYALRLIFSSPWCHDIIHFHWQQGSLLRKRSSGKRLDQAGIQKLTFGYGWKILSWGMGNG